MGRGRGQSGILDATVLVGKYKEIAPHRLKADENKSEPLPVPEVVVSGTTKWDRGYCGDYMLALKSIWPVLKLGLMGERRSDGWEAVHFFAHDDYHAYDVAGATPLQHYLKDCHPEASFGYQNVEDIRLAPGTSINEDPEVVLEARNFILKNMRKQPERSGS